MFGNVLALSYFNYLLRQYKWAFNQYIHVAGVPDHGVSDGPAVVPPGLPDLPHHGGQLRLDRG